MKLAAEKAVEMTVAAKPCGFRPHLGNRCAIPTFPPPRRLLDCFLNSTPERSFPQPSAQASFRLILRLEKTDHSFRIRQLNHGALQVNPQYIAADRKNSLAWDAVQGERSQRHVFAQVANQAAINLLRCRGIALGKSAAERVGHQLRSRQLVVRHPKRQRIHTMAVAELM